MSDEKARRVTEDENEEVEAHRKHGGNANEEAKDEAAEPSSDDDFEAHRKHGGN
jgi:hypothetical protein